MRLTIDLTNKKIGVVRSMSLNEFLDTYNDVAPVKIENEKVNDFLIQNLPEYIKVIKKRSFWASCFYDSTDYNFYVVTHVDKICTISRIYEPEREEKS